jgi:hypothetical protein
VKSAERILVNYLNFRIGTLKNIALQKIEFFKIVDRYRACKVFEPNVSREYKRIIGDVKDLKAIDKKADCHKVCKAPKLLIYGWGDMDQLGPLLLRVKYIKPSINNEGKPGKADSNADNLERYGDPIGSGILRYTF